MDDPSVVHGGEVEERSFDFQAIASATDLLADDQDVVSCVEELIGFERQLLKGSGPFPHRFRNALRSMVDLAVRPDGHVELNVQVERAQCRLSVAPQICLKAFPDHVNTFSAQYRRRIAEAWVIHRECTSL
jgi:hypothetical protein